MSKHRFKRGDIIKQDNNRFGFDYFHVEQVYDHACGGQSLDVIGDENGVLYGLDADFSFPATLRELVDDRDARNAKKGTRP